MESGDAADIAHTLRQLRLDRLQVGWCPSVSALSWAVRWQLDLRTRSCVERLRIGNSQPSSVLV